MRIILRCWSCKLVQFKTGNGRCRKCHESYQRRIIWERPPMSVDDYMENVRYWLCVLRKSKMQDGMKDEEFARGMGTSRMHAYRACNGSMKITGAFLLRLLKSYPVNVRLFSTIRTGNELSDEILCRFAMLPLDGQRVVMQILRRRELKDAA